MHTQRLPYLLLCLLFSLFASAKCPDEPILPIVEAGDRAELEGLAEALKDCPEWVDSLGLVYYTLGVLSYKNGDMAKAAEEMQEAVNYRKKAFAGKAHEDLGRYYFNLGYFHEKLKNYGQALTSYKAAAAIQQQLDNRALQRAPATVRVAGMHRYAGDFDKAERLLRWVIEDTQDGEALYQAKARLDLGLLYAERKAYQKAIRQLQLALPYLHQQEMLQDEASTLLNLAKAHYHLGHFSETKQFGSQALAHYQALEYIDYQARVKSLLGLAAMKSRQHESAALLLKEALELARKVGAKEDAAAIMDNIGELALQQGKPDQAADWFLKAMQTLKPDFSPSSPLQQAEQQYLEKTPYKVDLSIYLNDLLRAFLTQYEQSGDKQHLQAAAPWLQAGDYLIDQLRSSHSDASTKLFWREEALPFYERAVRICTEQQSTTDAFYFLEKSQSVLLLEALAEADALSNIPDSLQQQEQTLRRQLNSLQQELDEPAESTAELLDEIIEAEQQLENLTEYLSSSFPVYQRQTGVAAAIEWPTFQNSYLKGHNRTLLHYLFGKEQAYLLYANGQTSQLIELGGSDSLAQQVESFLHWFTAPSLIEQSPEAYKKQAYALFQKLLPIAAQLKDQSLIIVPGGPLAYVPFEALLSAPHAGTDLSTAPYLVNSHVVSYSFSATLYDQLENKARSADIQAYGIAPFAKRGSSKHGTLQYSPVELEAIAAHFPLQAFRDDTATRQAFTSAMGQATILHLSTHAYGSYDGKSPYIALADSSIYLTDLYQWDIPAELVVLSACQSNIGRLARGEGVLGLGRGFFYAGTKSVVASLWNLNDQSTSQVIEAFYTSLAEGQPKATALQAAKTQYLKNPKVAAFRKSPYYWAGLTYYGDSKPLKASGLGSVWWWALGAIAILGITAYFFWRRTG